MASPFSIFRKHSKVMMAALVVLCMGLFVFSRGSGGDSRSNDASATAPVASWNGGSINQRELASLVAQRRIVDEFLWKLLREGQRSGGYDLPAGVPELRLASQNPEFVERAVFATEVTATLARAAGINVSDEMINRIVREYGLKSVDTEGVRAILASIGQNGAGGNEALVFDGLRKLLMSYYYDDWYRFDPRRPNSSWVVAPTQRWNDWRRVNERISLRAAILPAESFLPTVAEPTEEQLRAFYNDFKDAEPGLLASMMGRPLPIPNPGFKEPRRVRMEFLLGGVADRAEKLASEVTDDEIKNYYDRNKRTEFVKSDLLGDDVLDEPAADADADSEPSGDDSPSAPDAKADESTDEQPKSSDSSEMRRRSPFRFVALQAPAADSAAKEEPQDDEPASQGDADSDDATSDDSATVAESVEYEPLEKVQDEIRKKLATDRAVDQLEQVMSDVAAQLQSQYNRYASSVAAAREVKKPLPQPSEKLTDLKSLAERNGLTVDKTALLSARQLSETAVGKAVDLQSQRVIVAEAFGALELYEPVLARDLNGDWYLTMLVEDRPERVPTFEEVRDRVAEAWKLREAAKLAEAEAKRLAVDVEKANQPFDEFFADRGFKVIPQTQMFSWRSYLAGPGQGSPILSTIAELDNVDPAFMEAVFQLDGKKAIALLNSDHSAAYVVQLHSRQYSPEDLKRLFLEEANSWPGQIDMLREHISEFLEAASRDTEERAGLKIDDAWQARRQKQAEER